MVGKLQIKRTSTPNLAPVGLDPGELSVEMAYPTRLWVGVPAGLDPTGRKLLINAAAVGNEPYLFQHIGKPPAAGSLFRPVTTSVDIPASLAGTVGYADVVATAAKVFTLNKISGGVTTALGTITATIGSKTVFTLAGAGGSLAAGDVLQLLAPTPQDTTLADVAITILARRT